MYSSPRSEWVGGYPMSADMRTGWSFPPLNFVDGQRQGHVSEVFSLWRSMNLSRAKLKASSRTSALLAGFAMVALVELELDDKKDAVNPSILILYAVCTALLVSVHLLALMMSTCILPHIESITSVPSLSVAALESPHLSLRWYIELAWFFSTVLGLLLFLLEIGILFWIKLFRRSSSAAYVTLAILVPVFALFIWFTLTFYRKLAHHRCQRAQLKLDEMDDQLSRLENGNSSSASKLRPMPDPRTGLVGMDVYPGRQIFVPPASTWNYSAGSAKKGTHESDSAILTEPPQLSSSRGSAGGLTETPFDSLASV